MKISEALVNNHLFLGPKADDFSTVMRPRISRVRARSLSVLVGTFLIERADKHQDFRAVRNQRFIFSSELVRGASLPERIAVQLFFHGLHQKKSPFIHHGGGAGKILRGDRSTPEKSSAFGPRNKGLWC
jgi:hypothetical protein